MPTRRDLAEANAYRRSLLSVALRGGSGGLRRSDGPERPNRALYVGIAVAALALLGAAAHGYLSGAPAGWRTDGSLVVDRQYGGRYLVEGGVLRPIANLTSLLLLTDGHPPTASIVDDATLRKTPAGATVGVTGVPDQPPVVRPGTPLTACATGGRTTLVAGALQGTPLRAAAALVRDPSGARALVAGSTAYPAPARALTALGYNPARAVSVARPFLRLLRPGPTLRLLSPPGFRARRHATRRTAVRTPGTVVVDARTGQWYVVTGAALRPVLNRTSRLLLAGHRPIRVTHTAIVSRRTGPAFGLRGVPSTPPAVPATAGRVTACTSPTGGLRLYPAVPAPAADTVEQPAPGMRAKPTGTAVESAPGAGVLVAVPVGSGSAATGPAIWLVADAAAFRLADSQVASSLGYDARRALRVSPAWLALLPRGPSLPDLSTGTAGS